MRYGYCFLFSFFLFSLPSTALAEDTTALTRFLNDLSTLKAEFTQRLYSEQGDLLETVQGQLFIQRPNRFRWHYQNPYEQLIIADGTYIWIYDTDLEQVTQRNLSHALSNTPAFLISPEHQVEQDFTITALAEESGFIQFRLVPKADEAQFSSIEMSLYEGQLHQLQLSDNLGQITVIKLHNGQTNQALADELFQFTPPPNADIIEDL